MLLSERYSKQIAGIYSCNDRIVIQGTLPVFCYAGGMTSYLRANNIRIFDYARFAEPLRNELRENAEKIAKENNSEIDFKCLHYYFYFIDEDLGLCYVRVPT